MVYIKRVELSHFKSFGGTADIPLLPGFTVVTGPNGSGKSNILDGLLFALGLSSSKGMRADRLPDLVNQSLTSRTRSTIEASVTATFDLEGWEPEAPETAGSSPEPGEETPGISPETNPEANPETSPETPGTNPRDGAMPGDPRLSQGAALGTHLREWSVTRKLRVTPQGTYTSTYAINGETCTLTQLHEQLNRLRIYPEGYNIVLQGDVTGIISMNGRERREIIDELAGVAQFDRKINQAKSKLEEVKEREDRCRIIERELGEQLERLSKDRLKAEKYQKLRQELQEKEQWEKVLLWHQSQRQGEQMAQAIAQGERQLQELAEQRQSLEETIAATDRVLEALQQQVRALGEEELLGVQAQVATQEAELRQVTRQQQDLERSGQQILEQLHQNQATLLQHQQTLQRLQGERSHLEGRELVQLAQQRDQALGQLAESRAAAHALASESQAWVQQQTQLRQALDDRLGVLEPLRREEAQLQERCQQFSQQQTSQGEALRQLAQDLAQAQEQWQATAPQIPPLEMAIATLATQLARQEEAHQVQEQTRSRLLGEQRDKQRQLDRLESMAQALQETQGTHTTRLLLQSDLPGIHGLVGQLGEVDAPYQLALEVAAGGRLTYVVVDDDGVASAGIQLLKHQNAGRATFLPLNKIRGQELTAIPPWKTPEGFVDHAVNLVRCHDRYRDIFAYVLGNTVVFESLALARRYLGQYRIVTLEGELLEQSGAMTGGSFRRQRGGVGFGSSHPEESQEIRDLRQRLGEIETVLGRCDRQILTLGDQIRQTRQELLEKRETHREIQREVEQLDQTISRLTQQQEQIQTQHQDTTTALAQTLARLEILAQERPSQEQAVEALRQALGDLEQSPLHGEWQQRQAQVQAQEAQVQAQEAALRQGEQQLQALILEQQRTQTHASQLQQQIQALRQRQGEQLNDHSALGVQRSALEAQLAQLRDQMATLEERLGNQKQERDRVDRQQQQQRQDLQANQWQQQKLQETQAQRREQLAQLHQTLQQQAQELPEPLPELSPEVLRGGVAALQPELRALAKRIAAMEPVNMLALEEYDRTEARLQDLTEKLTTLASERTEILLRIETFTTLRTRAFLDSFQAVDRNFREIFAQLSDGDGYLQLDNPEDPLSGGLTLVAHPKGKPVRRLASMSGGEKSLTALSFIFALQRYRPSPFYAFDEVDSFLDGSNVERLAQVIRQQCHQAQFIVVSHRRPMIAAAQRTIGVTQARGSHTQVVGITLDPQELAPHN